jgi:hypothetical protein
MNLLSYKLKKSKRNIHLGLSIYQYGHLREYMGFHQIQIKLII